MLGAGLGIFLCALFIWAFQSLPPSPSGRWSDYSVTPEYKEPIVTELPAIPGGNATCCFTLTIYPL